MRHEDTLTISNLIIPITQNGEKIIMTPADIFANMNSRFNADSAGDMNATVMFELTGENGGTWHVTIADGECTVHEGSADSAKATIIMDAGDYVAMTTGELNAMAAFMSGKIKVEGDLNTVMKFQSIFM